MILVHDFLRHSAARFPDKTALIAHDRRMGFADLDRLSDRLAAALQAAGVAKGDRVAIMKDNSILLVVGVFAVLKAGGVFVLCDPTTKAEKLTYLLNDAGARAIITAPWCAPAVLAALAHTPTVAAVFWSGTPPAGAAAARATPVPLGEVFETTAAPRDPGLIDHDLATIVYTSGSTGNPKGVMLTHRMVANTAWSISTYLGNVPEDVVVSVLPLSFDYGLYQVLTGARVGFTVLLEQSFTFPYDVLRRMAEHRVTGLPGVPTVFATLLQMAPFDSLDLSSLRYLTNTAAPLPPAHIRRLRALFPQARLFSMYGLTECTRVSYLDPDRLEEKILSVGKAMPNSEAYVVDEAGNRAPPGVPGELVVRGANVMLGYWNKPEETAQCLRPGPIQYERILYTGDTFVADEEGFLYFQGRKDDIFKSKGIKISPREIENVLHDCDGVAQAAVIGVPDEIEGHAIKAFIVPRDGSPLTEAMIRRHCRERLESVLQPKHVELCAELPVTATGKVKKRALA